MKLLWHKITANKFDSISFIMAGYSHILCFSKNGKPGMTFSDLLPKGKTLYKEGLGWDMTETLLLFLQSHTNVILDPFVGRGTVVALAEKLGLDAIGIDKDPEQCKLAKKLTFPSTLL